jgi:hypothetical protein
MMIHKNNRSEVARLLQCIDEQYQAVQRMFTEPAITAPHAFITARQEQIASYVEQLREQVGDQQAFALLNSASSQVPSVQEPPMLPAGENNEARVGL